MKNKIIASQMLLNFRPCLGTSCRMHIFLSNDKNVFLIVFSNFLKYITNGSKIFELPRRDFERLQTT